MRWAIVVLIILGLLAALSASLLVQAIRSDGQPKLSGKGEVKAVVAARALPAMSLITSQDITVKNVPRKGLSINYLSDPVQVAGRVLAVPVTEGQVIMSNALISEGTGAQLAAVLQPGMRAVSVPVSSHSVMGGLLYPGCLVDVIATFRLNYRDDRGQAISTTLLRSIQVLAIQNSSVISTSELDKASNSSASRSGGGDLTVTLMVDTRQAEALQLAMDNGRISLAMRNPNDQKAMDTEGMVLSQGRLARAGELLSPSVLASSIADPNGKNTSDQNADQLKRLFSEESTGRNSWGVTVIRGREVKEEVVGTPGGAASK
jgi:pilus assembly protein CpaB